MVETHAVVLPAASQAPALDAGSIFFIGNATVLLRYGGFTVLTDPNFVHRGDQVSIGYGLHTTRRTNPVMEIDALPPLDLVVLSHMHGDHFDQIARARLDRSLPIVSTPQAVSDSRASGFAATHPLHTWESLAFVKGETRLRITAMPAQHGPRPVAALMPETMGSLLEFERVGGGPLFRLYITGDTVVHPALREIPRRYPAIDLALIHLGGTRLLGILLTMDAGQGVELLGLVEPRVAIPIHANDYTIFTSRPRDFVTAVQKAGREGQVQYLNHGDTYRFAVPAAAAR